jgi:hypothetical protein
MAPPEPATGVLRPPLRGDGDDDCGRFSTNQSGSMTPARGATSINEGRPLVARQVGAVLIDLRGVVTRQCDDGSSAGEGEDEDQCCDEGLHGRSPLVSRSP